MKVLMIAGKDAANQTLARIAKAYVGRGHEVIIYAIYYAENVLHWFDGFSNNIKENNYE